MARFFRLPFCIARWIGAFGAIALLLAAVGAHRAPGKGETIEGEAVEGELIGGNVDEDASQSATGGGLENRCSATSYESSNLDNAAEITDEESIKDTTSKTETILETEADQGVNIGSNAPKEIRNRSIKEDAYLAYTNREKEQFIGKETVEDVTIKGDPNGEESIEGDTLEGVDVQEENEGETIESDWEGNFLGALFGSPTHGQKSLEGTEEDRGARGEGDLSGSEKKAGRAPLRFMSCNRQQESASQKFVMLVSTLDGKVTALNGQDGQMEWSLTTGTGPLLSSSISNLVATRDGQPARLIPSLDGSLYQLDVDGIEAVPLSADVLLSSSYRLSDDSMVVGGKDVESYGIDLSLGSVVYMCSSMGCRYFDAKSPPGGSGGGAQGPGLRDTLVIRRTGQTVRAVDIQTGHEKWNYSVAQHDVTYAVRAEKRGTGAALSIEGERSRQGGGPSPQGQARETTGSTISQQCDIGVDDMVEEEDDYGFSWSTTTTSDPLAFDRSDVDLKVIVPSGTVVAVSRTDPQRVYWQHQFGSAVANAWLLRDRRLTEVSLFDDRHVPALTESTSSVEDPAVNGTPPRPSYQGGAGGTSEAAELFQPVIYVGSYQEQLYVQPSVRLIEEFERAAAAHGGDPSSGALSAVSMPRVRWKPYIATAPSRTPAVLPQRVIGSDEASDEVALAPWHEQYPFDSGYYLYPDHSPVRLPSRPDGASVDKGPTGDVGAGGITRTELVALSFGSAFAVILLTWMLLRVFNDERKRSKMMAILPTHSSQSELENVKALEGNSPDIGPPTPPLLTPPVTKPSESSSEASITASYVSRYMTDFEQRACLGRGGFGVVFCALNRLDDCEYAVKRIALNDSDTAREKVMREVKALAKLDHAGIVRYYQSWFERPPPGWQEERDLTTLTTPGGTGVTSGVTREISESVAAEGRVENLRPSAFNPLRPFEGVTNGSGDVQFGSSLIEFGSGRGVGFNSESCEGISFDDREKPFGSVSFDKKQLCDLREKSTSAHEKSSSWSENAFHTKSFCENHVVFGAPDNDNSFSCNSSTTQGSSNHGAFRMDISLSGDSTEVSGREDLSNDSGTDSEPSRFPGDSTAGVRRRWGADQESSFEVSFRNDNDASVGISSTRALAPNLFSTKNPALKSATEKFDDLFDIVFADDGAERSKAIGLKNRSSRPDSLAIGVAASLNRGGTEEGSRGGGEGGKGAAVSKLYLYIQMQLCQRESLKDWLCSNTLNRGKSELIDIFHQIVSAIGYVHDSGLMHRDLKPSNIFFAMNGSIKIGDFGLVTAVEENSDTYLTPVSSFSRHTDQVGTQLYMSPEQCAGLAYTHKVDVYALGMIFFELFYPFPTQMERVQTLIAVRRLQFPQRFTRELSDEYEFVQQLLSHNPDQRPSAAEILLHPLFAEFEDRAQACSRFNRLSRQRTLSTSSRLSSSPPNTGPLE